MKTAVLIISHARVNKTVAQNFPWYQKSGGVLFGVCDRNTGCKWPDGMTVLEFDEIPDRRQFQLRRFLQVLEWAVADGASLGFERFALCEYDCIFVRPIPDDLPGLAATRVGQRSQGFHGRWYYHCPWIFSLDAAKQFLMYANRMMECGLDEGGFIDRFIGLQDDLYGPAIFAAPNYSQNSIDRPEFIREAQSAVQRPDCFALHGIKTHEQLHAVILDIPQ